jgi:hypothetical protein
MIDRAFDLSLAIHADAVKVDTPAAVSRRDEAVPSNAGYTEINNEEKEISQW